MTRTSSTSDMPSEPFAERDEATERQKVYLDALELAKAAGGTVCVTRQHYTDGRHPVPYRMGYCCFWRTADEHWHLAYEQMIRCQTARGVSYDD